jgi:hypothetical protein
MTSALQVPHAPSHSIDIVGGGLEFFLERFQEEETKAFSSEVDTGSHEENASDQSAPIFRSEGRANSAAFRLSENFRYNEIRSGARPSSA